MADSLGLKVWAASHETPYAILVAAASRGKARALAARWFYWPDFVDVKLWRRPAYDRYATAPAVWASNDELPAGAPDYWIDDWVDGDDYA